MNPKDKSRQLTGGGPAEKRRELDFYPTPSDCTHALMQFLNLDPCLIWEPACGKGHMQKIIELYGHEVIGTDISHGDDFLSDTSDIFPDAIITNPPFNLSEKFIRKSLKYAPIVCMLLKSQYWHAKSRLPLFNELPPSWILPLTWRPDFLFDLRESGDILTKGSPTMEMAWTVWMPEDTQTKFKPLARPQL